MSIYCFSDISYQRVKLANTRCMKHVNKVSTFNTHNACNTHHNLLYITLIVHCLQNYSIYIYIYTWVDGASAYPYSIIYMLAYAWIVDMISARPKLELENLVVTHVN
jgi:hypothetical protein